jgi:cytochrome c553
MNAFARWWWCVVLVACGASSEPESAGAASGTEGAERVGPVSPAPPAEPIDLRYHMNTSFWGAVAVRDALIDGDLERAREEALRLSRQAFPEHPDAWDPWVAEMQGAAAEVSLAPDAQGVGRALGLVATTCAKCHARTHRGPEYQELDKQGAASWKDEDLTDRMRQHWWAANELWLGLVTPSELSWSRGASALRHVFLTAPEREGAPLSAAAHEWLLEVRALGERARRSGTPNARATVYGELLARCGSCHGGGSP